MTASVLVRVRRGAGLALLLAILTVSLAFPTAPLRAHAIVLESTPAAGAVLRSPDLAIDIRFNSRIDHARSVLTLTRPGGKPEKLTVAAGSAPDRLAAKVQGLTPGKHVLRWQVLAVDGHFTRGDIPFTVSAP